MRAIRKMPRISGSRNCPEKRTRYFSRPNETFPRNPLENILRFQYQPLRENVTLHTNSTATGERASKEGAKAESAPFLKPLELRNPFAPRLTREEAQGPEAQIRRAQIRLSKGIPTISKRGKRRNWPRGAGPPKPLFGGEWNVLPRKRGLPSRAIMSTPTIPQRAGYW